MKLKANRENKSVFFKSVTLLVEWLKVYERNMDCVFRIGPEQGRLFVFLLRPEFNEVFICFQGLSGSFRIFQHCLFVHLHYPTGQDAVIAHHNPMLLSRAGQHTEVRKKGDTLGTREGPVQPSEWPALLSASPLGNQLVFLPDCSIFQIE